MPKVKDLTGLVQGRLTVLELLGNIDGKISYKCQCSCGNVVVKSSGTLRGGTKSCGCLYTENARKALKIAAETRTTHGLTKTPTYICWRNMKARCDDVNHPAYINYGERGVGYPQEWFKFEGFLEDMGMCPEGLTLNRIDVNLDYSKENCEWVDNYKQGRDRRKPKGGSCKFKGVSFVVAENKYKATLVYQGIYYHLGYSDDPLELALRYDAKVLEVTGSMGGTNKDLGLLDTSNHL